MGEVVFRFYIPAQIAFFNSTLRNIFHRTDPVERPRLPVNLLFQNFRCQHIFLFLAGLQAIHDLVSANFPVKPDDRTINYLRIVFYDGAGHYLGILNLRPVFDHGVVMYPAVGNNGIVLNVGIPVYIRFVPHNGEPSYTGVTGYLGTPDNRRFFYNGAVPYHTVFDVSHIIDAGFATYPGMDRASAD